MSPVTEPITTDDADTGVTETVVDPKEEDFDPAALDAFIAKVSSKASAGGSGKKIRRRIAHVTVYPEMCEPDAFDKPFRLTIEGLSSAQEATALQGASDGFSMGLAMGKLSIRAMNGKAIKTNYVAPLWEALGFAGRIAVMNSYLKYCTGANAAELGKSLGVAIE